MGKTKFKKSVALVCLLTLMLVSVSPIFAIRAQAQWIDISQAAKEYGLDSVGWLLANTIIQRMSASTVNWINSGFNGSPAYVTNPQAYFTDIGDVIAGDYIFNNSDFNFLCGNVGAQLKIALSRGYLGERSWICTMTDVVDNVDGFMNDFSQGGWEGFFELTQVQQNNPIGMYLQAESQLNEKISQKIDDANRELDRGSGFLSFKQCKAGAEQKQCTERNENNECTKYYYYCDPRDEETVTPGSVIQNRLNNALEAGPKKLEIADELNEIISSLLNQLAQGIVGGVAGGLRGLSGSGSSNTNSLTSQLSTQDTSEIVDYFGNEADTSILDVGSGSSGDVYTTDELLASANSLTYNTNVTTEQMESISNTWIAKIAAGEVTNIASNSVLAYMLGWGGLQEGETRVVSGITYQLNTGTWIMLTNTNNLTN